VGSWRIIRREATLAAVGLVVAAACRSRPPETRIVVVTATPAPIAVAPVAPVEEPTPTQPMQSAEFAFPVAQPTEMPSALPTPADVRESAFEPRREPTPGSLHEQLARCLFFSAEKDQRPVTTDYPRSVYVRVTARNNCDQSLPGWDAWVEVSAVLPVGGRGLVGREFAHFEGPIAGRSTAETFIRITNERIEPTEFYRYDVALWPEAGTGRRPES
jgi:hypothetical protein